MEQSRRTESLGARPVLVVDFGAQYAQLIARRVREAHVYSEIVPHSIAMEDVRSKNPCAIILSGGPSSVYEPHAPSFDTRIFELDVPVFGICYGFQAMAQGLGGSVARTGGSEYGGTTLTVRAPGTLLSGLPETQNVWMSHGDSVDVRRPDSTYWPAVLERRWQREHRTSNGRSAVPSRSHAHRSRAAHPRALPVADR